jgi:hypothetical protein
MAGTVRRRARLMTTPQRRAFGRSRPITAESLAGFWSGPHIALVVAVIVGISLRISALAVSTATLDADEAVTGLMVRRILSGQQAYIYYAGQTYNGSIEQYLQAGVYEIFRLPQNPFTLRILEVFLSALVIVATYVLARLVLSEAWMAVLAASFFAIGPYWNLWLGTRSYGSYDATQLVAIVGVICALKATGFEHGAVRVQPTSRVTILWSSLFGLCCGFCLWAGLTGFEILIVVGLWLAPTVLRSWRAIVASIASALVGAAPLFVWVIRHHGLPGLGGPQPPTTLTTRAAILFRSVASEYLGFAGYGGTGGLPVTLDRLGVIAVFAMWVLAIIVRRRGILDVITLRRARSRPIDMLLLVFPVAIGLYLSSPYSWFDGTPRYLFVLFPLTSVSFAAAIAAVLRLSPVRFSSRLVALVCVATVALGAAGSTAFEVRYLAGGQGRTTDAMLVATNRYLVAHNDQYAYAEYWTAIPSQYFAVGVPLTFAPFYGGSNRFPELDATVNASPNFVYVSSRRDDAGEQQRLLTAFRTHHVHYVRVQIGSVSIFSHLTPALRPTQLGL